eukprot:g7438.t1
MTDDVVMTAAETDEAPEGELQEQAVRALLRVAETKISEGESGAEDALAALLHAVRITQGEDAIMGVLENAKRRADTEAQNAEEARAMAHRMTQLLVSDTSTLLYEQGQEGLLKSAFEDGSSVVCSACQALVPRARFAQHRDFWCEAVVGESDDD